MKVAAGDSCTLGRRSHTAELFVPSISYYGGNSIFENQKVHDQQSVARILANSFGNEFPNSFSTI